MNKNNKTMWEGSHHSRKQDFPECSERALHQLKLQFVRESSSNIPGLGGATEEKTTQLVEELVFGQGRNKHLRVPPSVIELQILELIVKLFQDLTLEKVTDKVSFALFQSLFGRAVNDRDRLYTLERLLSLAVSVECHLLLDTAATWLQLQGVHTSTVQILVDMLIKDFASVCSSSFQDKVNHLSKLSPHFCCLFISAVTVMYKFPGSSLNPRSRSFYNHLLPVLTKWISEDPSLCLVSLFQSQQTQSMVQPARATLWTSPTKPNTQTPIPGLVRWCTQGPLNNLEHSRLGSLEFQQGQSQKVAAIKENYKNEDKNGELEQLWSKLHLGILQTLAIFPSLPGANQLEVITLADMTKTVEELVIIVGKIDNVDAAKEAMEEALDRMVQVIQLALATGAFRCSLADLKKICKSLPETKLRGILESQHLSNNPPAMHNAS